MIRPDEDRITFAQLRVPLVFILVGLGVVVLSIPGQGKNVSLAIGFFLSITGVFLAKRKIHASNNRNGENS